MLSDVLILASARRAGSIAAKTPNATVTSDPRALDGMQACLDAVIIDGVLEDETWDRWLLQRAHRALRTDGRIVVRVPRLASPGSLVDVRFLAYASRWLLARLRGVDLAGPARRRYHLPRLIGKMRSLGYGGIEASAAPLGRATITARKAADATAQVDWYAKHHASVAASGQAWLRHFPELRGVTPRALEPREWRDARVLVLSPHPDDELIGCGGTLCRFREAGAELTILQATDGSKLRSLRDEEPLRRKTVRLEEATRVARGLDARLVAWHEEDSTLAANRGRAADLARLIAEWRPTHVFTPFLGDPHSDHRALSNLLAEALPAAGIEPRILQYEVWSRAPANVYCDITTCAETLERLMFCYESAMQADDFVHFCEGRNLARALELTERHGYVEAFLSTTSAEYRALAARSPHGG